MNIFIFTRYALCSIAFANTATGLTTHITLERGIHHLLLRHLIAYNTQIILFSIGSIAEKSKCWINPEIQKFKEFFSIYILEKR